MRPFNRIAAQEILNRHCPFSGSLKNEYLNGIAVSAGNNKAFAAFNYLSRLSAARTRKTRRMYLYDFAVEFARRTRP